MNDDVEAGDTICIVPLSNSDKVVLIDVEDREKVAGYTWRLCPEKDKEGYAVSNTTREGKKHQGRVYLHTLILTAPSGMWVDHKDPARTLNCRKSNLRCTGPSGSNANRQKAVGKSSKYKGVNLDQRKFAAGVPCWKAGICVRGNRVFLGYFNTERKAALAYNVAALMAFGEFAHVNKVEQETAE